MGWKLDGGVLKIGGDGGGIAVTELRSKAVFGDYVMRLEFQFVEGSFGDSGVGVGCSPKDGASPSYVEVQILPGKSGDLYRIGGMEAKVDGEPLSFSSSKKKASNEKPAGEWNRMELRVSGGGLEVRVNGELQNGAEGLPKEGKIVLRNEGNPVWFRNLVVMPLE